MVTPENRAKYKTLERIICFIVLGVTVVAAFALLISAVFKNAYLFFAYVYALIMFGALWTNYYLTFKIRMLSLNYSLLDLVASTMITVTVLTYIAGGYSGAMISVFFVGIVVYSILLNRKEAILLSLTTIILYLIFFIGDVSGLMVPVFKEKNAINYTKAIMDMLSFFVVTYLGTIISENTKDSLNYYRLRSVRLSSIRKSLQTLVKKRTRELENSNRKLRLTESELRSSNKELKKLDVEKDEFISIAAHELKTPLTAIGGYAQLLNDDRINRNPAKRKEFLSILDSESRRLAELVTEILNLSRIDLGVMKYKIENVDAYDVMRTIDSEFNYKFKKAGLKHEVLLYRGLPRIETDKSKLYEIITNLISNAIKYTPRGKITIRVDRKEDDVIFSVEDTGIGIAKKDYGKIFKRFSQIDSSITREYKGSGLGLSICKEYATNMGGRIWFKSRPSGGTTFFLKLPMKFAAKEEGNYVIETSKPPEDSLKLINSSVSFR